MPGLPELPITTASDAVQVDGDPDKYGEIYQTHRGPKPAPDAKAPRPHGHMMKPEETTP